MRDPHPPYLGIHARMTLHAHRHPKRHGRLLGAFSGILFGFLMGSTGYAIWDASLPEAVLTAVGAAIFFGLFMGLFLVHALQDTAALYGYPIGTEHRHVVDAHVLLVSGRPGPDPITNEVARKRAEMMLGTPYHPKTTTALFSVLSLVLLGTAIHRYSQSGPEAPFVVLLLLALGTTLVATVLLPLDRRKRRRAAAFLDALEE